LATSLQVIPQIPKNEAIARELAPLLDNPKELTDVWNTAFNLTGGEPTASLVRAVVARMRGEVDPGTVTIPSAKAHDLEGYWEKGVNGGRIRRVR
jgi:hypothetical protein